MTKHTDTSRSGDLVDDDFAPIWDESILLAEHEAVQASVAVGGWLSAALDDPNVCAAMKADINRWFSAGFLYLDEVRKIMQADRIEALEAERDRYKALVKEAGEGLAFYADDDRYEYDQTCCFDTRGISRKRVAEIQKTGGDILFDRGDRAAATLAKIKDATDG